jgi:hypothetical protein
MKVGLLWYDDDPGRSLEDKVRRAAAHYERKYGHAPDLCFVHPGAFNGKARKIGGVEIRPGRSVLPHHFWVGVADANDGKGKHRPHSLAVRAETAQRPLTPEQARQLVMELESQ